MKDKNILGGVRLRLGNGAEGWSVNSLADVLLPPDTVLVMPQQTHTSNVGIVSSYEDIFPDTDALITLNRKIAVGVRTADCVPILIHAADIGAVAAIHAGWKGTQGRIVEKTIEELRRLGAKAQNMFAAVGPAICGECYETGSELAELFESAGLGDSVIRGRGVDPLNEKIFDDSTVRIDLVEASLSLLSRASVPDDNIFRSGICTRHSGSPEDSLNFGWPSWRRTGGTLDRLITYGFLI